MTDPVKDDDGLISQDEIDRLLGDSAFADLDLVADSGSGNPADDLGELTQADIDMMMGTGPAPLMDAVSGEDDGDEELSLDDFTSFLNESDTPSPPKTDPAAADDDETIDESQAVEVADCLVTQETLDGLLRDIPAPVGPVVLDEVEPAPDTGNSFREEGPRIHDVTQDDIDALLQESDDGDDSLGSDEDLLISQDDIDSLLMAADQEDEDLLDPPGREESSGASGGPSPAAPEISDLDDMLTENVGDEDILDPFGKDAPDSLDPVILRQPEFAAGKPQVKSRRFSGMLRSKKILALAMVVLIAAILTPIGYFIVSPPRILPPVMTEAPSDSPQAGIPVDTVAVTIPEVMDPAPPPPAEAPLPEPARTAIPGSLILTDFIVLASDEATDMAYVSADITIDYSDQQAYHDIMENMARYRDVIYESIRRNMVWEKRNQVTEQVLLKEIETALKSQPSGVFIQSVSFKSFTAT